MSTAVSGNPRPLTPKPQFTVHDKQREVVESDARFRALKWGRRAGKNITANIDLIEIVRAPWEWPHGGDNPDEFLVWWLGKSYDQANKYGFQTFISAVPDSWIANTKRDKPYVVELTHGATVEFRTYDRPDTLQGAGVDHHIVDEAAYCPRSLWDNDLEPMLMDTRGSAMFISKPRPGTLFEDPVWNRVESPDYPEWVGFHATSASNPFIEEDPTDKQGTVPDKVYRQEYLAEFVDDSGEVFEDLDANLFTRDEPPADPVSPFAHGWDLARHEDYTVGVILDAHGRLVEFYRTQDEPWPVILDDISDRAAAYEGVLAVDASRDNKIVSDIADRGHNVEPVRFTPKTKRNLIQNLATRIENGELATHEVPQLRHELQVFTYDTTPSGNIRYHAEEGFHDDAVDALALASHVLDRVQAIERRRDRQSEDSGVSFI